MLTYEDFLKLSKPEHDEFMADLQFMVNNTLAGFQYANLIVEAKRDPEVLKQIEFKSCDNKSPVQEHKA